MYSKVRKYCWQPELSWRIQASKYIKKYQWFANQNREIFLANHDLFIDVKIVNYYILKASLIKQKTSKKTKSIASVKRGVHVIINEGLKMLKKGFRISQSLSKS